MMTVRVWAVLSGQPSLAAPSGRLIQRQRFKHPKQIRPQLLMSQKLQMWSMWRMKAGEWEEMVMRLPEYDQNQTQWSCKHSEQQWKEKKQKERRKVKSKTKTREQQKQHVNTQWKIKIWYDLKFHSKPFVDRCWGILVLIKSSCLG